MLKKVKSCAGLKRGVDGDLRLRKKVVKVLISVNEHWKAKNSNTNNEQAKCQKII